MATPPAGQPEKLSRKQQILQVLAHMLETSPGELITTANLAKAVGVSEAALYRHFPSKFKMFEGLIDYIEDAVFSRVNRILEEESRVELRCERILWLVLSFAEKNPGLARLLYGDVLAGERQALRVRVAQFHDRLQLQLKQCLRDAEVRDGLRTVASPSATAALLGAFVDGRISQYARSDFRQLPTAGWPEQWQALQQGVFTARQGAFHAGH